MTRSARKPSNQRRPSSKKIDSRAHQYLQGKPQLPFSDAVLAGDTLYLSGRIGLDTNNNKVPDDVEAEARYMLEDVRSVLARANMKMSDLVYVQVFCTDISLWERFNAVYRTFFDGQMPARAFFGTGALLFGAHFEIQGIAVRR